VKLAAIWIIGIVLGWAVLVGTLLLILDLVWS
jgi:hypothetical protein